MLQLVWFMFLVCMFSGHIVFNRFYTCYSITVDEHLKTYARCPRYAAATFDGRFIAWGYWLYDMEDVCANGWTRVRGKTR